jgi:hypothetical protein
MLRCAAEGAEATKQCVQPGSGGRAQQEARSKCEQQATQGRQEQTAQPAAGGSGAQRESAAAAVEAGPHS